MKVAPFLNFVNNRKMHRLCSNKNLAAATRQFSCLAIQPKSNSTIICYEKRRQLDIRQRYASTDVAPSAMLGFWQSLSNSTPVSYMQDALITIHDTSGLPWWATIVGSTIIFRSIVTLPLAIYQHKITARIEKITLEMPAIVEELKREASIAKKKFNWTDKQTMLIYRRSIKKQWNKLIVRDNCHPMKTMIVLWAQVPLWIFQSVALRNLLYMLPDPTTLQAQIIATEMTVGGFGWIPNLFETDNSYILPVALGLLNLGIIELQSCTRTRPATRLQSIATNVFRGFSVIMVPIACTVPSALCVYWVASSSYGLMQNLLLLSPEMRRAVGIPKTNTELEQPYKHVWNTLQKRIGIIDQTKITTGTEVTVKELEKTNEQQTKRST